MISVPSQTASPNQKMAMEKIEESLATQEVFRNRVQAEFDAAMRDASMRRFRVR
jgi:hypothetical protein